MSYYQVIDLIEAGYKEGRFLSGHSPNDWFPWTVNKLSAGLSIQGLEFFSCEPGRIEENVSAFLFRTPEIERIRDAISIILSCAQTQPDLVAKQLVGYDASDVLLALDRAAPSLNPKGDDGVGINFLFAYLKSFESFCRSTLENGRGMVHAQWW